MTLRTATSTALALIAFLLGFDVRGRLQAPRVQVAAAEPNGIGPPPSACDESSAMTANRRLAEQVRDYKQRLERTANTAGEAPRGSSRAVMQASVGAGVAVLQLPCSGWNAGPRSESRSENSVGISQSSSGDFEQKVFAAGVPKDGLPAVEEAYRAAAEKVWKSVDDACSDDDEVRTDFREYLQAALSGNEGYDDDTAEHYRERVSGPEARRERCLSVKLAQIQKAGSADRIAALPSPTAFRAALKEELETRIGIDASERLLSLSAFCTNEYVVSIPDPTEPTEPTESDETPQIAETRGVRSITTKTELDFETTRQVME